MVILNLDGTCLLLLFLQLGLISTVAMAVEQQGARTGLATCLGLRPRRHPEIQAKLDSSSSDHPTLIRDVPSSVPAKSPTDLASLLSAVIRSCLQTADLTLAFNLAACLRITSWCDRSSDPVRVQDRSQWTRALQRIALNNTQGGPTVSAEAEDHVGTSRYIPNPLCSFLVSVQLGLARPIPASEAPGGLRAGRFRLS